MTTQSTAPGATTEAAATGAAADAAAADAAAAGAEAAPPFRYNATLAGEIEARWQDRWDADGTFFAPNPAGPFADPDGRDVGRFDEGNLDRVLRSRIGRRGDPARCEPTGGSPADDNDLGN